ncbi:hypothetical protein C2869_12145 [Saccharobesus litoralis]|uniref:Uncharacterized protein n=1 Tax=Saccharobesus litoralis TaxID=2172099 RepID=A0A2S0VSE4_9ALTE|nr:DUF480 domain-containing protein [Saccharobesus litoralis]AWB67138.1 hypothetical protein C2869_12145 [Saccharobesus litoralis]
MKQTLSFEQTRVLGVFLEKEVTTPDQYPLSINGITTACNQKSNREPVVSYSEVEVQNIVDELVQLRLLAEASDSSGRVAKYRHRFAGSDFSAYPFDKAKVAIICVLFLRGPQTPGELRTRAQRLYPFADVGQVESILEQLANEDEPFIVKLPREAGKRESRYAHLFSGEVNSAASVSDVTPASSGSSNEEHELRISQLEQEVTELKAQLAEIKSALDL